MGRPRRLKLSSAHLPGYWRAGGDRCPSQQLEPVPLAYQEPWQVQALAQRAPVRRRTWAPSLRGAETAARPGRLRQSHARLLGYWRAVGDRCPVQRLEPIPLAR